jgi:hypothetical protein
MSHIARHTLLYTLPRMGLVDVNTVIAWYYNELVLEDPRHTIYGMPVSFTRCTYWNKYSTRERNVLLRHLETNKMVMDYKSRRPSGFEFRWKPRPHTTGFVMIDVVIWWDSTWNSSTFHTGITVPQDLLRAVG